MPKPTKGARLGGSPAHQKLMLANLATSLFSHGRITTTEAKARRLRPFAEKLVTHAKHGDLAHRREVMKIIRDKSVVHALFADIGPFFADRPGGYTRIIKTMPRKGDNAPMAVIELLRDSTVTSEADRARRVRQSQAAPVATAGATAADSTEPVSTEPTEVEPTAVEPTAVESASPEPVVAEPAASAASGEADDVRAEEAVLEQEAAEEASGSDDAAATDGAVEDADADIPAEEQVPKDSPS